MAEINRINPPDISKPFSNYSHVVTAEGARKLVFCAGQVAADADGNVLPPDDFDAQAKMVMENLTKALAAGGAKNLRCNQDHDLHLQPARRVESARHLADLFRRPSAGQYTLHIARARQSQFPAGNRSNRRGVSFAHLRGRESLAHRAAISPR
jgi:hypothetical protein